MKTRLGRRLAQAAFALAIAGGATLVLAEEVWVKRPELDVRAGKGAAFETVATVKKGQKLEVVAREGTWVKVKVGDREGYVSENSLSDKKVSGGGGISAFAGGPDTSGATASAGAKGLDDMAEKYAADKGMDPKRVDEMIARTKAITGEEWAQFTREGKVGPDKPQ
jgi:uncharacterized protein YraI